ncbi:uncharacterized protein LOC143178593 isoform X2 [Calliopsis andreniformis]|uniref:uncharacterized protein LOC143178593 isoform X2 n=1 Tax=Calliopsis andreniformis TaxID=337506 RepID=UPI003FCDAFF3
MTDVIFLLEPPKRKNFLHENVKNLRRMEQLSHMNKEIDEAKNLQYKHDKHENVSQKLSLRKHENNNEKLIMNGKTHQQELCRKSSSHLLKKNIINTKKTLHSSSKDNSTTKQKRKENTTSHKHAVEVHRKVLSESNFSHKSLNNVKSKSKMQVKFKNQGSQTLDEDQIEKLYSEGIVRYPSKKCLNYNNSMNKNEVTQQTGDASQNEKTFIPNEGNLQPLEKDVLNKFNFENSKLHQLKTETDNIGNKKFASAPSKLGVRTQTNSCNKTNIVPTNYRKGVVPKYIKERKEAQEKEQKAKAELLDPDCPSGHVSLPDHERQETLRILKKNYQDYVNELNMMPIRIDTLKAQRRKTEIEKQLNKLEEGIKVFSKPKVYVKMNA